MSNDLFHHLYENLSDPFFRYLKGHYFLSNEDAQDIVADTFCKVRDTLSKIKVETAESYARKILINTAKDFFRKHKLTPFSVAFDGITDVQENADYSPDTVAQHTHQWWVVAQALSTLDQESQDIVFWKYVEGRTHEEISSLLNITIPYVRKKLSRANKKIQWLTEHVFE